MPIMLLLSAAKIRLFSFCHIKKNANIIKKCSTFLYTSFPIRKNKN